MKDKIWTKDGWRAYPVEQQPEWPDTADYEQVLEQLSTLPALVFAGETRALRKQLAEAVTGQSFVLHCGDCAEEFARCTGPRIHALVKVFLQMSIILAYAGERKVVNIARLAGQYVKPRSLDTEQIGGLIIPSYRGDMVNRVEPTPESRRPNPKRIIEGYFRATATLNLVRAFTHGGYAAWDMVSAWHQDFLDAFQANRKYEELVRSIQKAIAFAKALGMDVSAPQLNQMSLYTSHEALLLGYEEALTRIDTTTGLWYDTSAHFLWIGDRTRQSNGGHVEFLRGVNNPIGLKIGPNHDLDEIRKVIQKLNPRNEPGRLTLITRFGTSKIAEMLPRLVRCLTGEGINVVWCCDPMHGNTYTNTAQRKTRRFEDILLEIHRFFLIHAAEGTIPGGIHLEMTGDNVTECTGGRRMLADEDLNLNYQTACDPRINAEQAVELAFEVAEHLNPWQAKL